MIRRWTWAAALLAIGASAPSCGGDDETTADTSSQKHHSSGDGGSAGEGSGGDGGSAGTTGGGTCTPGEQAACYTGPVGTEDVGACTGGMKTCSADGASFGPCEGEVTPDAETCETPDDDDCDGEVNEEGAGCVCVPGTTGDCYTGPAGTEYVGLCAPGTATCNAMGTGYGPCAGEVTPAQETCNTPGDEDCDNHTNEEGPGCSCAPGTVVTCYSGPPATQGVGPCHGGTQACKPDGTGYESCTGEVTPEAETCTNIVDDDCDGQVNESGVGCVCAPNSVASCYSGPGGTQGIGICKSGTETCNGQGTAWGPCSGEVTPQAENCATPADENCDGMNPPCQGAPIIDLRGDANRNGTIDLADPSEDAGEDTWDASHGAVFLANIDDDQKTCPNGANLTDAQLAACNDAADSTTNGADDLSDLARLKTVAWPQAPADAKATISLSAPGSNFVRLFKLNGGTFQLFDPASGVISSNELKAGVEFAIEGKDFVRDTAVWNGFVDVTLNVDAGTGPNGALPDGSDKVRLRVAPVIFRHHLDEATSIYVTNINSGASQAFRNDMSSAIAAAGVPNPMQQFSVGDQWTQDFFETAYMSMPGPNGVPKVIHVNFRSANYTGNGLRAAGKVVFTVLRGKDVAGAVQYDPNHSNVMDTLNSFGNLETIPPYTLGGQSYPLGRVLRGSTPGFYPDQSFQKMVSSQVVQSPLVIDTEWLLVAHVDETLSFLKVNSPRGWIMLRNDPTLAKTMLQQQQNGGFGNTSMFVGKFWQGNVSAQVTINQVLADPDVMNESAWAATKVDQQMSVIKQATGITDAEIVKVPFLHQQASGYTVAYQPGTVNGVVLSDNDFGSPRPWGPVIGGEDIFEQQLEQALSSYGYTVRWIEDWDLYHRLDGEVHCGSNATRKVPNSTKWWESGL